MVVKSILKWVGYGSGVVTIAFALPTLFSTYSCINQGTYCSYALFGPSESALSYNIKTLEVDADFSTAKFVADAHASKLSKDRIQISVRDKLNQWVVYSSPEADVKNVQLSDDRLSAIVVKKKPATYSDYVVDFLHIDRASNLFVNRSFLLDCNSEDSDIGGNLTFDPNSRLLSFDVIAECQFGRFNDVSIYGPQYRRFFRLQVELDQSYLPTKAYPNRNFSKRPTEKELAEKAARDQEYSQLINSAHEAVEDCIRTSESSSTGLENSFIKVCEAPEINEAEYVELNKVGLIGIAAKPKGGPVTSQTLFCSSDVPIKLVTTADLSTVAECSTFSGGRQQIHVIFVDKNYRVNKFVLSSGESFDFRVGDYLVTERAVEFAVKSQFNALEVDALPVALPGANTDKFGPGIDRGRVIVRFSSSGWPISVDNLN